MKDTYFELDTEKRYKKGLNLSAMKSSEIVDLFIDDHEIILKSLKKNLDGSKHEILIFIDNDNQDTYGYLKSIKNEFFDLKLSTD